MQCWLETYTEFPPFSLDAGEDGLAGTPDSSTKVSMHNVKSTYDTQSDNDDQSPENAHIDAESGKSQIIKADEDTTLLVRHIQNHRLSRSSIPHSQSL